MEPKKKKNKKKKNLNNISNEQNNQQNTNTNNSDNKVKYFLMIPLEQDDFIKTFNNISEKLENEKPNNFDKNLLQKPQSLKCKNVLFLVQFQFPIVQLNIV